MLKHNTQNRVLSQATVNRYAALMKDGEWAKISDMISFDSDGTLTNGQHRMEAVVTLITLVLAALTDHYFAPADFSGR